MFTITKFSKIIATCHCLPPFLSWQMRIQHSNCLWVCVFSIYFLFSHKIVCGMVLTFDSYAWCERCLVVTFSATTNKQTNKQPNKWKKWNSFHCVSKHWHIYFHIFFKRISSLFTAKTNRLRSNALCIMRLSLCVCVTYYLFLNWKFCTIFKCNNFVDLILFDDLLLSVLTLKESVRAMHANPFNLYS